MFTVIRLVLQVACPWVAPSPRPRHPALGLQAMGARREHVARIDQALNAIEEAVR